RLLHEYTQCRLVSPTRRSSDLFGNQADLLEIIHHERIGAADGDEHRGNARDHRGQRQREHQPGQRLAVPGADGFGGGVHHCISPGAKKRLFSTMRAPSSVSSTKAMSCPPPATVPRPAWILTGRLSTSPGRVAASRSTTSSASMPSTLSR